jgi:tetratricopeptide (TPR) repeat protein
MKWGDEYAARGQPEQAVAQYDSAINMAHTLFSHLIFNPDAPYAQVRVPPAYSEPWFRKGRLLAKMKRTKKAIAIFEMILEMDPQNQVALLNEAELLSETGEHEAALRTVDRVLAIVPNHPDGVRLRATIVEAARASAEAKEKEAEAEDAESVFGPARPAPAVAPAAQATSPPPSVPPPEDDFETI